MFARHEFRARRANMNCMWPHPLASAQSPDPGVPMLGTVLPEGGVELVEGGGVLLLIWGLRWGPRSWAVNPGLGQFPRLMTPPSPGV